MFLSRTIGELSSRHVGRRRRRHGSAIAYILAKQGVILTYRMVLPGFVREAHVESKVAFARRCLILTR